jgi:NAD(P)-dependent dehydrogenase (short-subunit alcohol dehydrogenase family)
VELTFAVCHLGHFALALGLHEALRSAGSARVISVSSGAHLASPVVFDDISFRFRSYTGGSGYGQAKTANVLFAVGMTDHWAHEGILANAVTPGIVPSTNLSRHRTTEQDEAFRNSYRIPAEATKTLAEGAATPVFAATSPLLAGTGGRYLEDCAEAVVRRGRSMACRRCR